MNLYEALDFFKEMFPGKEIKYEFDDLCVRTKEFSYTNGKPNCVHHIDCNKVKIIIDGMDAKYVPIMSHRICGTWAEMKPMISKQEDVYIHPGDIQMLKDLKDQPDYQGKMSDLMAATGLSQPEIEAKL